MRNHFSIAIALLSSIISMIITRCLWMSFFNSASVHVLSVLVLHGRPNEKLMCTLHLDHLGVFRVVRPKRECIHLQNMSICICMNVLRHRVENVVS